MNERALIWRGLRGVRTGLFFFFSSRRRHTRFDCDWSSDVCSSDLKNLARRTLRRVAIGAREHVMLTRNAVHVRVIATSDAVILGALESVENSASLADRKSVV